MTPTPPQRCRGPVPVCLDRCSRPSSSRLSSMSDIAGRSTPRGPTGAFIQISDNVFRWGDNCPGMSDDNKTDATDASSVGTVRELLRGVGDFIPWQEGDELADEFDRTVESLAPKGTTADDVDAVVGGAIRKVTEQTDVPVAVRDHELGYFVTVDLPPYFVEYEIDHDKNEVVVKTTRGDTPLPVKEGVDVVEWRSNPTDDMAEFLIRVPQEELEEPDAEDDGGDTGEEPVKAIPTPGEDDPVCDGAKMVDEGGGGTIRKPVEIEVGDGDGDEDEDEDEEFDYGARLPDGQFEKHPTTDEGEFVQPVRRTYEHADGDCDGSVTTMGESIAESFARGPNQYDKTFCARCGGYYDLSEFVWEGTAQPLSVPDFEYGPGGDGDE